MKNKPLIIGIIVVILLAGVGYFAMKRGGTNPLTPASPGQAVTSAFSGSGSVKCDYTTEAGQTIAYVKNGMVRTDITGGEEPMSFLMRDKTTYSWNQTTKKGFMYKIPEVTPGPEAETTQTGDQTANANNSDEVKAKIEQYKESCVNQNVDDSMFVVPTDVTFQDYSTMMQGAMQKVPADYQQYMPQQ